MTINPSAVLITGCSSGIGHATAERFLAEGWRVAATARRVEDLADLAVHGALTLALDVDDDASITTAVRSVKDAFGTLDVLVNNAGYGQMGPLVTLSRDAVRRQLETNVVSQLEVTKAVVLGTGGMLEARRGRVVMIGSIVGQLATPFSGPYCASKFALRALSDVLRVELAAFGVEVVQIEPGPIATRFSERVKREAAEVLESLGPYSSLRPHVERRLTASLRNASTPEVAAQVVFHAATTLRPRTRYMVTGRARLMKLLRTLLPDRLIDSLLAREFGLHKPVAADTA